MCRDVYPRLFPQPEFWGHETYLPFDFEPDLFDHSNMEFRNRYVQTKTQHYPLKTKKNTKKLIFEFIEVLYN